MLASDLGFDGGQGAAGSREQLELFLVLVDEFKGVALALDAQRPRGRSGCRFCLPFPHELCVARRKSARRHRDAIDGGVVLQQQAGRKSDEIVLGFQALAAVRVHRQLEVGLGGGRDVRLGLGAQVLLDQQVAKSHDRPRVGARLVDDVDALPARRGCGGGQPGIGGGGGGHDA